MGHIYQQVKLTAEKPATVEMFVDTGATFSMIPDALARAIGVRRLRRRFTVSLADGRRVKFGAGLATVRIGDREVPSTLLVGDVPKPILGVETLEALGLTVDARNGRLKPSRSWTLRV